MIDGTLITESLRVGTNLERLNLTVRKISRYRAQGTTPDQPDIWTTLDFEADEAGARGRLPDHFPAGAGVSTIIGSLYVPFVAVLAWAVLRERPSRGSGPTGACHSQKTTPNVRFAKMAQ